MPRRRGTRPSPRPLKQRSATEATRPPPTCGKHADGPAPLVLACVGGQYADPPLQHGIGTQRRVTADVARGGQRHDRHVAEELLVKRHQLELVQLIGVLRQVRDHEPVQDLLHSHLAEGRVQAARAPGVVGKCCQGRGEIGNLGVHAGQQLGWRRSPLPLDRVGAAWIGLHAAESGRGLGAIASCGKDAADLVVPVGGELREVGPDSQRSLAPGSGSVRPVGRGLAACSASRRWAAASRESEVATASVVIGDPVFRRSASSARPAARP